MHLRTMLRPSAQVPTTPVRLTRAHYQHDALGEVCSMLGVLCKISISTCRQTKQYVTDRGPSTSPALTTIDATPSPIAAPTTAHQPANPATNPTAYQLGTHNRAPDHLGDDQPADD